MAESLPVSNLLKNSKEEQGRNGLLRSITGNQVKCSLPCNVNSGDTSRDFLEEAKRTREMRDKDYAVVDMETERLLENDLLARGYEERLIDGGGPSQGGSSNQVDTSSLGTVGGPAKYTSKATLQIQSNRASNVDDPLPLDLDNASSDKKTIDANTLAKVVQHSKYQVIIPAYPAKATGVEEKKMDENGNAVHQTKEKKKKKQSDKNVVVLKSENIEGHKSEIINNVDQLLHYIEGTTENNLKPRPVQSSKSKQLHKQHASEDGGSKQASKKRNSKSGVKEPGGGAVGEGRHELKKSNSLGEISGMKLDREFEAFSSGKKNKQEKEEENVVLRGHKPSLDRARERRSWGNVEAPSFQTLYNASSLENLETSTDTWEVTRPKKKSKKRRNSVSSASGARQNSSASGVSSTISNEDRRSRRAPSPDLGVMVVGVSHVKTTRSMPHSEKSNDSSSDVDSVHSLPMDGPISYADIAKNIEKKKPSPEKQDRPNPPYKEKSPLSLKFPENDPKSPVSSHNASLVTSPQEKTPSLSSSASLISPIPVKSVVPDVHNIKSFPAITGSVTKSSPPAISTTASYHTQNVTTTSDKAVQSTLTYEETFAREKTPPVAQKSGSVGVTLQTVPMETTQGGALAQSTPLAGSGAPVMDMAPQVTPAVSVATALTPPSGNKRQASPNSSAGKSKGGKEGGKVGVSNRETTGTQMSAVQGFFGGQGDVQGELSIMKDPAQYAVQRMPPDIVDVATLEKMQFMNYSSPTGNTTVSTQSVAPLNATPVSYTQTQSGGGLYPDGPAHAGAKGKRRKGASNGGSRNSEPREEIGGGVGSSVCDSSLEERGGGGGRMVNGISDETFSSPEPCQQPDCSPPPVVILSGHSRDAPLGLIFGFDINEQLLLEDSGGGGDTGLVSGQNVSENILTENHIERLPCGSDEWATRFKPPSNDKGPPKHNHEKIVSFISTAWEAVINQKVHYYSDSL